MELWQLADVRNACCAEFRDNAAVRDPAQPDIAAQPHFPAHGGGPPPADPAATQGGVIIFLLFAFPLMGACVYVGWNQRVVPSTPACMSSLVFNYPNLKLQPPEFATLHC